MKQSLKEWGEALIYAVVLFVILYFFMFPVRISGPSMETTFQDGDRVAVCRVMAGLRTYDRGDIVVFRTDALGDNEKFIKRVIGLPGDEISLLDGVLRVNGTLVEEPYAQGLTEGELFMVVPEDAIFVMGDNREHSTDSRHLGPIAQKDVQSVVLYRFYPLNEMRFFYG